MKEEEREKGKGKIGKRQEAKKLEIKGQGNYLGRGCFAPKSRRVTE